jgi:hypothetical protein
MERSVATSVGGIGLDRSTGFGRQLAARENMPAWPARFPAERVREYEFELGQYAFAGQCQQSPTPRKGGIFKREYWQPYVVPTTGAGKGMWPDFDFIAWCRSTQPSLRRRGTIPPAARPGACGPTAYPNVMLIMAWRKHLQLLDAAGGDNALPHDPTALTSPSAAPSPMVVPGRLGAPSLKNGSICMGSALRKPQFTHACASLRHDALKVIPLGWAMHKAEHYRKEANRCADLAKTAQLDFLNEIYRKAAVRYVLMAEEAERPDPVRGGSGRVSLWDRAEQLLAETR